MGPYNSQLYSVAPLVAVYGPTLTSVGVYYTNSWDMSKFSDLMLVAMTGPNIYGTSPSLNVQLQYSNMPSGGTWTNVPAAASGSTATTAAIITANSQATLSLRGESLAALNAAGAGTARYLRAQLMIGGTGTGTGIDTTVYVHAADARYESALVYQLSTVLSNSIYTTTNLA